MDFPDDPGLVEVLSHLGVQPHDYLGHGGEAWVYGLDDERVVRVLHAGGNRESIGCRERLVNELRASRLPFALPEILDVGERHERVFVIERRLPGRSVLAELAVAGGATRARLIENHLAASAALGDLQLAPREYFGDLIADDPIRTETWRAFLHAKAINSLAKATPDLRAIDPGPIAAALPEPSAPAFVHLDAFAGNMLTDGATITAVVDFGVTSVIGDRRIDPVASAVYLTASAMTPTARPSDADIVHNWLRSEGLADLFEPVRRWLALFWCFAVDDPSVLSWCRSVLRP